VEEEGLLQRAQRPEAVRRATQEAIEAERCAGGRGDYGLCARPNIRPVMC
jgi:hypothetical protein